MAKADLIKMEMLILDNNDVMSARNIIRDLIIAESNYSRVESEDITSLMTALAVLQRITHRKDKEIKKMFDKRNEL